MRTETVLNNIAIGKSDNLVLRIVHICVPVDSCFDLENEISLHLWYTRQRTHWHDVSSSGGWDGWMRRRKARRGILYLWAIALSEIRLGRFDGSSTRRQTRLDLVAAQSRRSENRPIDRPILSFGAILVRPCLSSYIQTCAETVHQLTELLRF